MFIVKLLAYLNRQGYYVEEKTEYMSVVVQVLICISSGFLGLNKIGSEHRAPRFSSTGAKTFVMLPTSHIVPRLSGGFGC